MSLKGKIVILSTYCDGILKRVSVFSDFLIEATLLLKIKVTFYDLGGFLLSR